MSFSDGQFKILLAGISFSELIFFKEDSLWCVTLENIDSVLELYIQYISVVLCKEKVFSLFLIVSSMQYIRLSTFE